MRAYPPGLVRPTLTLCACLFLAGCGSDSPQEPIVIRELAITLNGTGAGRVALSDRGVVGGTCGATTTVSCSAGYRTEGQQVTLTATPLQGSGFAGWQGACTGTGACVVTMSEPRAVTALFHVVTPLTLTIGGTGSGQVAFSDVGLASGTCANPTGTSCVAHYAEPGTTVTLTATAAQGSTFLGWSGGICFGTGTCTVPMGVAREVIAVFSTPLVLDVVFAGAGTGVVTFDPFGQQGSTCVSPASASCALLFYLPGQVVTLNGTADGTATFAGWSGGACTGTGPCTVTLNQSTTLTATFNRVFELTLQFGGTGHGMVTLSAPPLPFGTCAQSNLSNIPSCVARYTEGELITLTAAPSEGYVFSGWSGSGCAGTGACVVTMTAARTVTAAFDPAP